MDLEARNYAYMFELFGQFVRDGIVEKGTVMNALKYIVSPTGGSWSRC